MPESDGLNDFIFVLKIFEYDIGTIQDYIGTFEDDIGTLRMI